jgi:hypothetical protein
MTTAEQIQAVKNVVWWICERSDFICYFAMIVSAISIFTVAHNWLFYYLIFCIAIVNIVIPDVQIKYKTHNVNEKFANQGRFYFILVLALPLLWYHNLLSCESVLVTGNLFAILIIEIGLNKIIQQSKISLNRLDILHVYSFFNIIIIMSLLLCIVIIPNFANYILANYKITEMFLKMFPAERDWVSQSDAKKIFREIFENNTNSKIKYHLLWTMHLILSWLHLNSNALKLLLKSIRKDTDLVPPYPN